jgi:hypothetical protein
MASILFAPRDFWEVAWWFPSFNGRGQPEGVAQVFNLLYRRFLTCIVAQFTRTVWQVCSVCRMKSCDTAD